MIVFLIAVIIILLVVIWGVASPETLATSSGMALDFITFKFGWFYLLATFFFLLFSVYLAFSKYGKIKLGNDDDEPEYSNRSWFAMLFSAGMGIGLIFYGATEPLSHYVAPPQGAAPMTSESARLAMRYSFFHWGLHAWAIYAVIGLAIAYFTFRKNRQGLISSLFYPLIGDKIYGPLGKTIDILAIIATCFGVATSLGLGTLQINGGFNYLMGTGVNTGTQLTIIAVVTVLYLISATTGIDKGIKILSNTNLVIAAILLIFVLFAGPTAFIFDVFTNTIGSYIQNLVQMSLRLSPFRQGTWIKSWTLFYWSFWIAWAPFVGMFIARISRGRTIKQFILGVLVVPTLFDFLWFSVFGGTALNLELFHGANIAQTALTDITSGFFNTIQHLPLGNILAVVATVLIIIFFVTSADSATFVLGMLSSKGVQNPPNKTKIIWGILQSSIAAVLLLSGGLTGLQSASIIAGVPFAIIMVLMCYSLYISLTEELKPEKNLKKHDDKKVTNDTFTKGEENSS